MSLAEKSDGLLDTYVHWEDVEKEMQKALQTTATFGPNKTVTNIGEGNGVMSRICLIKPDWINGSKDLPELFVTKIPTAISAVEFTSKCGENFDSSAIVKKLLETCPKMHNMEIAAYKTMQKYSEGRIPLPKIYASRNLSEENKTKGYILMEYLDDIVSCHLTDNLSIDSMKKILRYVAIWQGIGLRMTQEERKVFQTTILEDALSDVFSPEMGSQIKMGLEMFCGEDHHELIQQFIDLLFKFCERQNLVKLDAIPEKLGYDRIFCHGDLWSTNILWMKQDDSQQIRSFIDFQNAGFNTPALDLARVFSSCLSGKDRRNHYKELLSTFYEYLREEVEGELPYTLEQLETSYNYLIPFGALGVIPMVGPLLEYLKNMSSESAAESRERLLEKSLALMKDSVIAFEN